MNWRDWFGYLGIAVPLTPDIESLITCVVLIAGSASIGWFIGHRTSVPLTRRIHALSGRIGESDTALVSALTQLTITALLLLIVGNSVALSPLALLLLGASLGIVLALLVWKVGRKVGLAAGLAGILAALVFVATTAGTLGGLRPLIAGLDSIGLSIGQRRMSLLSLINAVVIVVVLYAVTKAANHVLRHLIGRTRQLDVSQRVLVQKLAGIAVIAVAVFLGIDLLGIDLTALTVFSGAVGLAVGFGLQKTFGNLIAGVILLMDRSIKPGDVIVVGDSFGTVEKVGVRAVSVVTRDGKEHLIPNEQLMTEPVENWSYTSRNVRVHIPVGVAYSCDLPLAQKLMIEAATASSRALPDPAPTVWLKGFGDSAVDHEILVWIGDPEAGVGNVQSDVLNRLWILFKENDIEIPFPQRDVHIRSMPSQDG